MNNAVCGNADARVHPNNDSGGHHDEAQTYFFIIGFKSRFAFTLKLKNGFTKEANKKKVKRQGCVTYI
jgi:hypothetical protein